MVKQLLHKLNLQLFAEPEEEIEVDFEIDDSDDGDGIELELEEDLDDEGDEVQEVHGQQGADGDEDSEESDFDDTYAEPTDRGNKQVKEDGKGKNATAAAVIAERKKWQSKLKDMEQQASVTKRFMEQIGVSDINELNRRMDAFEAQKLQDYGVPEELAHRIAMTERIQKEQQADIRRQKHAVEVAQLKNDPFYADIDDYLDELGQTAERTGMSIKATYLAEHGERRLKEREAEIEAKVRANKEKRQAKKVDVSPTGTSSSKATKRINLSQEERAIAKLSGMSDEEYAKFKKR